MVEDIWDTIASEADSIRPEAEDDLEKAFSWYEDKRKGLGYDFLLRVADKNMSFHRTTASFTVSP
ncbi:MAG: hypothetical protein ACC630_00565 [Nitrospinota bacterium]